MITAAQMIVEVRRLVGVRFLHQGRSIGGGVDCLGVGLVAAKHTGLDIMARIAVTDARNYGNAPTPAMLDEVTRSCRRLSLLTPGALLMFKMPRARYPYHLGIYTDKNTFVHAEAIRKHAVIEQTFGRPWTRLLHSIWAIPGVEYAKDAG